MNLENISASEIAQLWDEKIVDRQQTESGVTAYDCKVVLYELGVLPEASWAQEDLDIAAALPSPTMGEPGVKKVIYTRIVGGERQLLTGCVIYQEFDDALKQNPGGQPLFIPLLRVEQ